MGVEPTPQTPGPVARTTETLPKTARVRRRPEFRHIQSRGERVHTSHFIVMVLMRPEPGQRVGITVTKKVGSAVARNRIKRVIREVFRKNRDLWPAGCDLVFIAKQGASVIGYAEALDEMSRARRGLEAAAERSRQSLRRLDAATDQ